MAIPRLLCLTIVLLAACGSSQAQGPKTDKVAVLLPADPAARAGMKVTALPAGYSASGSLGRGATLEITGLKAPGTGALSVQKTEYGYDASLVKAGAIYNLTLQCGRRDKRCADEGYIRELAAGLKP